MKPINFFILILFLFYSSSFCQNEKINLSSTVSAIPSINVTLGGAFPLNGTYQANINERADQVISRIYYLLLKDKIIEGPATSKYYNENRMLSVELSGGILSYMREEYLGFSLRRVKLVREKEPSVLLNIKKFWLEGDYKNNPYLQNNDVLIFEKVDLSKSYIQIEGAVKYPGRYEYVRGDKLSDAIYYAGGIDETYEGIDSVYIYRQNEQGEIDEIKRLNVKEDIELKNKDRIKVIYRADQRKDYRALIIGEVRRPGYVYIGKSRMKLREAIKESGGFTQDADLRSSVLIRSKGFFREMSEIEKRERWLDQYLIYRMARMSLEDSVYFSIDNMVRMNRAIASIDFEKVMIEGSEEGDFMLDDEDVIIIPRKSDKVYVFGQVNNPGFIKVKEKEDWRYYIEKGGGLGESASGEVYIIKNVSRSWHNVKEYKGEIEAGDMIWAAKKTYRDFDFYASRIASIATITSTFITLVVLILNLTKK